MIKYTETPLIEIRNEVLEVSGVRLLVKREDLNHPHISGNKWWKLKYNLQEAKKRGKKTLLTFGGAYSNHIYSTAAAADEMGFESIGIIRGEETWPLNATLQFAKKCRMHLHYVSREIYRRKTEPAFIESLHKEFGDFFLIPEGGTNDLAVRGCAEFAAKLTDQINFDVVFLPVGTGGTMAGLIRGVDGRKEVVGVSILKDGKFLTNEIQGLVNATNACHWSVLTDYHHGGYAKTTPGLLAFMRDFEMETGIPLDPVYTGKLMWAVLEEIKKGRFRQGTTILAIHTGGLQGRTQ